MNIGRSNFSLIITKKGFKKKKKDVKSSLTLTVVTGLGESLAVGQHRYFGHSHTHHSALFTGLVLSREETKRKM